MRHEPCTTRWGGRGGPPPAEVRDTKNPALRSARPFGAALAVVALAFATAYARAADRAEPLPKELEGVGVTEHLNTALPLDAAFKDEQGRDVKLGDYFKPDRPVLLTLNYLRCPMLCTLQLNGLVDALKELDWTPGQEFEIVTISFDPLETPALAEAKKQNYLAEYARVGAGKGWHFLTGSKENITAVTEAVGFTYRWDPVGERYVHVAALMVCTPDGRLSRYLYDVQFEPRTVRLSLSEASHGAIGSTLDQILLYCFHYDAEGGRYAPAARRIMSAGGALTALVLGGALSVFWLREARRRKIAPPGPTAPTDTPSS
jgi:protein SCO1